MTLQFKSKRNYNAYNYANSKNEALLIGYFIAGDPTPEKSLEVIKESIIAGIDILEIGVPSFSPIYDGEIIKRGHQRVLSNNRNIQFCLEFWKNLRASINVPIWVMGYEKDLIDSGFLLDLVENKYIDGLILPDSSMEKIRMIEAKLETYEVDVVHFINEEMTDNGIKNGSENTAIVYAQLQETTGDVLTKGVSPSKLIEKIRKYFDGVVLGGFGINSPAKIRLLVEAGYDGAVVGSAFVSKWEHQEKDALFQLIAEMKIQTKKMR